MKTTRKLLAFVMVIAMIMAMAISASAAKITTPNDTEYQYKVYKLASYTAPGPGHNGYQVNGNAWKKFATDTGLFTVDSTGYINGWDLPQSEFVAKLETWLKTGTNYTSISGTEITNLNDVEPGYYVMVSLDSSNNNLLRVAADTIKNSTDDINLVEKNGTSTGLPQISKNMTPGSSEYYKVGDVRDFEIVVITDTGDNKYTITDTMSGLALVGDADDIEVVCSDPKAKTPVVTLTADGFKVVVEYNEASSSYETITIKYKAKVIEEGVNSITNQAIVKDQDDKGPGASTVTDSNKEITLNKVDGNDTPLAGAQFELYKGSEKVNVKGVDTNGDTVIDYYRPLGPDDDTADAVSIVAGVAKIKGLEEGTAYTLKETLAPAGYKPDPDTTFTAGSTDSVKVVNTEIDPLPETGGMGTTLFYTLGGLMVMAAAVLLVTKKRVSV